MANGWYPHPGKYEDTERSVAFIAGSNATYKVTGKQKKKRKSEVQTVILDPDNNPKR